MRIRKYRGFMTVIMCVAMLLAVTGCKKQESTDPSGNTGSEQTVNTGDSVTAPDNGDGKNKDDGNNGNSANDDADKTDPGKTDTDNGYATDNTGNKDAAGAAADNGAGTGIGGIPNDEMSDLMRLYTLTLEGMQPVTELSLPADSSEFSPVLASQALSLCSQGTKQMTTKMLTSSGFEILLQAGYDKDKSDPSHTCAFTLAKKQIALNGRNRDLLLICIRGTDSGEWFSNFDFAGSHSDDTSFAENFLQAAQDVYLRSLPTLLENPDAVLLVCGHSRGAACANLLGMTLDDLRSKENVYAYTFATPGTIRGDYEKEKYTNVFNLINPADLVTHLPIAGWGYGRVGNDLILSGDAEIADKLNNDMDLLAAFVPTISEYYGRKIKVDGLEGFEDGITAYETMLALASSMTGIESSEVKGLKVTDLYRLMGSSETAGELYPLLNFLKNMVGTDGNTNLPVFKQHMPAVYQELIAKDFLNR